MSYNTISMWCQTSHDHNWAYGSSLSVSFSLSLLLWDCGWLSPMLGCSISAVVFGRNQWFFRKLEGVHNWLAQVYFLSLQSTYGQSFSFPCKGKLGNALLLARSGCLQIQTLSSAALLPLTLNTVYDKSLLILYCSQHPCDHIQGPCAEEESIEPIDRSDSVSDSDRHPTQ